MRGICHVLGCLNHFRHARGGLGHSHEPEQRFLQTAADHRVFLGVVLSMGGLAWALKSIPVGTGYAAWVGVGAVTTAAWAMARGTEPVSTLKIVFLAGIIVCIVGLQLVSSGESH
jgi:multidrug transporter EmrE-like cation transporter